MRALLSRVFFVYGVSLFDDYHKAGDLSRVKASNTAAVGHLGCGFESGAILL